MADITRIARFEELRARARQLSSGESRRMLGITGPPGAGKSTLARAIVSADRDRSRLVEMDGFHLSESVLAKLGRKDRKGAIDTFDGAGFLALIRRLRSGDGEIIYAPQFRRELEEPVAGALPIEPHIPLVVVEGNYLLVEDGPWAELRALFDEVWYCEPDEHFRLENLISRHQRYGKSAAEARRWTMGPDQRNAALITATRALADVIVDLQELKGSRRVAIPAVLSR